jgi:hypothetical protein
MDLSNFDFDALDQATRDETLAQLSYPLVQDFNWDLPYPMEAAEGPCKQTDWPQTNWEQTPDDAYASNEPQGAL